MPELKKNLMQDIDPDWERQRRIEGFARAYSERMDRVDPVFGFKYAEDNIVDDLTKRLEEAQKQLKELSAVKEENARLRERVQTFAFDNKNMEREIARLNQTLSAFDKIQTMDIMEIEHWKSTVETISKSDQKACYLSHAAIVSFAKKAMKGPPK